MCTYIYMCIRICTHMYIHMYIYIYTHKYVHMSIRISDDVCNYEELCCRFQVSSLAAASAETSTTATSGA